MKEQVYLRNRSADELEASCCQTFSFLNPRGRVEHVVRSPCKMRETKPVEFRSGYEQLAGCTRAIQ